MGFEFKAVLPFIPFFIQQMEDNFSVLYRLAPILPDHNNINLR